MKKVVVLVLFCIMVFPVTVFALPVDGNWHELTKVSFDVGTTWEWIQTTPAPDNVIPVDIPYATPQVNSKYVWLCVPLSGDTWQLDATRQMEIRIFWEVKGNTQYDNSNFPYTALQGQSKWYQGTSGIAIPNLGGISNVGAWEYVTKFYNSDFSGGNIKTSMGAYTDIIIPADKFSENARSIWIPFQISNSVISYSVGITSISIRQSQALTDNQIFTEILNTVVEIANKKGLTKEEVQQAILGALDQFTAQDKAEGNKIEGQIDGIADDVSDKLKLDDIKGVAESIAGIFDHNSKPFEFSTPELSLNLSGQVIKILPSLSMNLSGEVDALINKTKQSYPMSAIIFDIVGVIYTITISLGAIKFAFFCFDHAFNLKYGLFSGFFEWWYGIGKDG